MRDAVRAALERLRSVWPSLPVTAFTIDAYADAVQGFSADVIDAGARLVIQQHDSPSAPKPAHLRAACATAHKARGGGAEVVVRTHNSDGCEIKCRRCGTVSVYHERSPDGSLGRLWPWHADDCPLRRSDNPRDGQSARIVWPQPRNGGAYRAPVKELVQEVVRLLPPAVTTNAR